MNTPLKLTGKFIIKSAPVERGKDFKYLTCNIGYTWGFAINGQEKTVDELFELQADKANAETLKNCKVGQMIEIEANLRTKKKTSLAGKDFTIVFLKATKITPMSTVDTIEETISEDELPF